MLECFWRAVRGPEFESPYELNQGEAVNVMSFTMVPLDLDLQMRWFNNWGRCGVSLVGECSRSGSVKHTHKPELSHLVQLKKAFLNILVGWNTSGGRSSMFARQTSCVRVSV